MLLKELTVSDIHEISRMSHEFETADKPETRTLADIGGLEWKEWLDHSARMRERIGALSSLARAELTALAWLGRGDSGDKFEELVIHARRSSDHGDAKYLAGMAPLHQYLRDGARKAGLAI